MKIGSGATPRGGQKAYLQERKKWALVRSQNVFDRYFDAAGLAYISDEDAEKLRGVALETRDVLINITGDGITFGRSCLASEDHLPCVVNQHVSIIRCGPELDPGFLLSFLTMSSTKSYIGSFNAGGSRRAITKGHIQSFVIPLPPLQEQRRIAAVLGVLDDKIQLNRMMNKTLEEMAQAIFKSWFIDFDGHTDLADSELGPIPRGWEVGTIGQFMSVSSGKRQTDRSESKDDLYRIPLVGGAGQIAWTSQGLYEEPLIVTGRVGTLGVVRRWLGQTWPSDNTLVLRESASGWFQFSFQCLQTVDLDVLNRGSTQPLLTQRDLKGVKIPVPPDGERLRFEATAGSFHSRQMMAERESSVLAELRDTLLPKLISGEIRVPEAEELVEDVR